VAYPVWIREKLFQKEIIRRELRKFAPDFDWKSRLLFTEHHVSHRKTEAVETVLARERASKPQHHLLRHLLDGGCDVHVEGREQIFLRVAHRRAEQVSEFVVGHG
jgi:hypothetical protein